MDTLRSDEGCPWDRKQTHDSLKPYLLEEAYELLDALDEGDDANIVDELGDVLLQVVFHARIASETGRFTMEDVVETLRQKLLRRHPHVFGDAEAADADAVEQTWAAVKQKERTRREAFENDSLLGSVPKALPALMEAEKIQRRAARVGFQWDDVSGAWEKITEELSELKEAAFNTEGPVDADAIADELGDVLFAVVNVARYLHVDPEQSLRATNAKFRRRFHYIERAARKQGRDLEEMTLDEMDALWQSAKQKRWGLPPP